MSGEGEAAAGRRELLAEAARHLGNVPLMPAVHGPGWAGVTTCVDLAADAIRAAQEMDEAAG